MVTTDYCYSVRASILDNKRQGTIVFTEKLPEDATENDVPVSATVSVTQHGLNEYNADTGEDIKGDIKLKVRMGPLLLSKVVERLKNHLTETTLPFIIPVGITPAAITSPLH